MPRDLSCSVGRVTGTYAICHFVVDLACVATVLGPVLAAFSGGASWGPIASAGAALMAYDMVAFALQLPIGAALDRLQSEGPAPALVSFALVAAGVLLALVPGGAAAAGATMLVALGNALFHDAGGICVLGVSGGRCAPSGCFIATGALGVFLGSKAAGVPAYAVAFVLVGALVCCAVLVRSLGFVRAGATPALGNGAVAAVVLLCVTVALRSYAGMVMAFPWKASSAGLALAAVVGVALGKACGGIVADRIGLVRASVVSLGGAALLFPLSWTSVAAGMAATVLFNFTMPITLVSLARLLPDEPGCAFGAASFSLAIGALPALMGLSLAGPWWLCALSAISLATLACGLRAAGEGR